MHDVCIFGVKNEYFKFGSYLMSDVLHALALQVHHQILVFIKIYWENIKPQNSYVNDWDLILIQECEV